MVITEDVVLVDRTGREWRAAPTFQNASVDAPGWLLLRAEDGRELTFSDVVNLYGFVKPDGLYLYGHYDKSEENRERRFR